MTGKPISLRQKLNDSMKDAMKAKDAKRLATVRLVLAALKDRDIAARTEDSRELLGDDEILGLMAKMIKQREESATAYDAGKRPELAAGEREGAVLWQPECSLPEQGWWHRPTVFTGVSQSHRIAREEIFGPVLSVLTFRTPAEAVAKANNTPYGLSAGVWTEKGSRILAVANKLRAGVVWSNTFNKFDPTSPFGGYKESGFGREGGRHGLEPYLKFDGEDQEWGG